MSSEIIEKIKNLALQNYVEDDDGEDLLDIYSRSGNNVSDAYSMGYNDGCSFLARKILDIIK